MVLWRENKAMQELNLVQVVQIKSDDHLRIARIRQGVFDFPDLSKFSIHIQQSALTCGCWIVPLVPYDNSHAWAQSTRTHCRKHQYASSWRAS